MSTYNGELYLKEQIESILCQQDVEVNLFVRDDGSTDHTQEILEQYATEGKLKWYTGENLRSARSFMHLVRSAEETPYYAFSDQDDVWKSDKLSRAIQILETKDGTLPLLYSSDYQLVDVNLNPLAETYHVSTTTFAAAILSSCATGCTVVFNLNLRNKLCEYEPEFQAMHDSWANRVCLAVGGQVFFDKHYKSIYYRQHGNNVDGGTKTLNNRVKRVIERFLRKECLASRQAQELLNGYSKYMSKDNLRITKCVAEYRNSIKKRLELFFSKEITTPYRRLNMGIKVAILFGYF